MRDGPPGSPAPRSPQAKAPAQATQAPGTGVRLMQLSIRNFRGIETLDLSFTGAMGETLELALLAGDNGSGKTAALEATLLLLGQRGLLRPDLPALRDQVRFGAEHFTLSGELEVRHGYGGLMEVVKLEISSAQLERPPVPGGPPGAVPGQPGAPGAAGPVQGVAGVAATTTTPSTTYWATLRRLAPKIEYFSARRRLVLREGGPETHASYGNQAGQPGGPPLDLEAHRLLELRRRLVTVFARQRQLGMSGMPQRAAAQAPPPERGDRGDPGEKSDRGARAEADGPIAKLQGLWQHFHGPGQILDILPADNRQGAGYEVVVREARPLPPDVTSLALARRMAPHRRDVPWMVPLAQLGSGQLALLTLAGPLLFGDARPDLVIIDEPEQQIHRGWQPYLLDSLRRLLPETQFLIATRSDEILAAAQSYEGFILLRPEQQENAEVPAERISFAQLPGRRRLLISKPPGPARPAGRVG